MKQAKKWISGLLAICMILSLCPTTAVSAHEHSDESSAGFSYGEFTGDPLWEFTSGGSWGTADGAEDAEFYEISNKAPVCYSDSTATVADSAEITVLTVAGVDALTTPSGEGWSYDAETATLTLDGFSYQNNQGEVYGIYAEGDLTIFIKSPSSIDVSPAQWDIKSAAFNYAGIYVSGNLLIQGNPGGTDALIVDAANTNYGIYANGSMEIVDCDNLRASSGAVGVAGGKGLTIRNSTINVSTAPYENLADAGYTPMVFLAALGSSGLTSIYNSTVNITEAGVTGILGCPVAIEDSAVNISADCWPIYTLNDCFKCYNSELTATNTLDMSRFTEFISLSQWWPFTTAIYSIGGMEFKESKVVATAPHFAIMEDGDFVAIVEDSDVTATGGYSGIYAVTQVYVSDSAVHAKSTFTNQEALEFNNFSQRTYPFHGILTYAEGSNVQMYNSDVTVEGGYYGIFSNHVLVQGCSLDIQDSIYPLVSYAALVLKECPEVYVEASVERLKDYMERTGFTDLVGAIQSILGPFEILDCEDLTAKGTMAGILGYNTAVTVEDSNVNASGGIFGITGSGITVRNSDIQADAVWTGDDLASWDATSSYAVASGSTLVLENAYLDDGLTVLPMNGGNTIADSDGNPVASATVHAGQPPVEQSVVLTIAGVPVVGNSSGDGWSFDAATSTLTLDGFNLTIPEQVTSGIYAEGDLTIVLKGENTIESVYDTFDPQYAPAGILVNGNLTIDGSSETGESLTVGTNTANMCYSIVALNVLTIQNCDSIKGQSGFVSIFGTMGFTCINSNIESSTPGFEHYMSYNLKGMHAALGSMGRTYISDSDILIPSSGLVGLMGEPLIVESAGIEVYSDAWGVFSSTGVSSTDSFVGAVNTMTMEESDSFLDWCDDVKTAAFYLGCDMDTKGSFIVAQGLHYGINNPEHAVIMIDSQIAATGDDYGLYSKGVTINACAFNAYGKNAGVYSVGAPIDIQGCIAENGESVTMIDGDYVIFSLNEQI